MNLKSILVSFALVAATSTAAVARPSMIVVDAEASFTVGGSYGSEVRDHRATRPRPTYLGGSLRDHRSDGRWWNPRVPSQPAPIAITNNTKLIDSNGFRWSEYTGAIYASGTARTNFVALTEATRIGQVKQDFWAKGTQASTIQLRGVAGSTMVTQVAIEFGPGSKTQLVQINRDLRNGSITIDLEGTTRAVSRIAVYGTSGQQSAYQLFVR